MSFNYNIGMDVLLYILIFNLIGSVISLTGGILLLMKHEIIVKFSHLMASFAAGSLLGAAFFDLLPEASHTGEELGIDVFLWVLVGFIFFFLLERFIHWSHHHGHTHSDKELKPEVPLIVAGDSIHNFVDGVAIAATFMVSVPLGITTALAVAAHEIPQEIADFGLLIHKGVKRWNVFWINLASAGISIVGALLAFFVGSAIEGLLPIFLALTAGFFIYIAAADLIPEIHNENRRGFAFYETSLLIAGIIVMYITINLLSGFHGHE